MPPEQQKLYERSTSAQAVAMLEAFDEFNARVTAKAEADKGAARKTKQDRDALMKGSLSGASARERDSGKPDDYDDGFNSEADRKG